MDPTNLPYQKYKANNIWENLEIETHRRSYKGLLWQQIWRLFKFDNSNLANGIDDKLKIEVKNKK